MNEGRARDREQRGQMTSPEQRRERDAARRSLNAIPQPQFRAPPDTAPLYRGGAYYPWVYPTQRPTTIAYACFPKSTSKCCGKSPT